MQQLPQQPPRPRKRVKTPQKNWVLEYTVTPKKKCGVRPIKIKNRYATEKAAKQALENLRNNGGMWSKDFWAINDSCISCK